MRIRIRVFTIGTNSSQNVQNSRLGTFIQDASSISNNILRISVKFYSETYSFLGEIIVL